MIRGNSIGWLLFLFCLMPVDYYLVLLIAVLAYHLMRRHGELPVEALWTVAPLFVMILSGMIFTDFDATYDILKDAWYLGKVILVALVGMAIGYTASPTTKWLKAAILLCSLAALVQLIQYAIGLSSNETIKLSLGVSILLPFVLYTLPKAPSSRIYRPWILAVPIMMAVALADSRTMLLVFFLSWLGARGALQSNMRTALTALSLALLFGAVSPLLPQYDINNITLMGKIQNSLNEIMFVQSDDISDISANWRGFEAYKAFQMWQSASLGEQVFGLGIGKPIDIGREFYLGGTPMRYLPILHNAYFAILVKFGLLGLGLFITFMTVPFWLSEIPTDSNSIFAARLGRTSAFVLIITTVVISGPLNRSVADGVTLLWGWSIGMQLQRRRSVQRLSYGKSISPAIATSTKIRSHNT